MKFRKFQIDDVARIALVRGAVNGWATGLGKGLAAFVQPLVWLHWHGGTGGGTGVTPVSAPQRTEPPARNECSTSGRDARPAAAGSPPGRLRHPIIPKGRVLLVIPGGLHKQICADGLKKFGIVPTRLPDQATFLRLTRHGLDRLPDGSYLTSYTELTRNGVDKPTAEDWVRCRSELRAFMPASRDKQMEELQESIGEVRHYSRREGGTGVSPVCPALAGPGVSPASSSFRPEAGTGRPAGLSPAVPPEGRSIRCVYQPALADLCCREFDVVVVDEGVRLQGGESLVGEGIRRMQPPYRLILTATPIKNRLQQIFFLLAWAAEAQFANARFPYDCSTKAQREFIKTFQVEERNLTKEAKAKDAGEPRTYKKFTPEVCNLHLLWKLMANLVLRRRKEDCGEEIVKKIRHVIRVPNGLHQSKAYRYQLLAKHWDCNGKHTLLPKMTACRVAAADPTSKLLKPCSDFEDQPHKHELLKLPFRSGGTGDTGVPPVSAPQRTGPPARSNECSTSGRDARPAAAGPQPGRLCHPNAFAYTPKMAATLAIIEQIIRHPGEQFMLGSPFEDGLESVAKFLREAGVPFQVCDGRVSEARRGDIAQRFQQKEFPGLLTNVESMAEGYDFWQCKHGILTGYSWAWDKFEQWINRMHRLLSPEDVHLWAIITDGTTDRRLEESINEKGDSQELVLDGKLLTQPMAEMNLADLYAEAMAEYDTEAKTIDEMELFKDWPALRERLRTAAMNWKSVASPSQRVPLIAPANIVTLPPPQPFVPPWRRRFISRGCVS